MSPAKKDKPVRKEDVKGIEAKVTNKVCRRTIKQAKLLQNDASIETSDSENCNKNTAENNNEVLM